MIDRGFLVAKRATEAGGTHLAPQALAAASFPGTLHSVSPSTTLQFAKKPPMSILCIF